jgi:hypothetical protein
MSALTIERDFHWDRRGHGARKELRVGQPPGPPQPGRVPRVARLMALALRFEDQVRGGTIRNYAELAELGHVSRARISQIMNLLNLAPDLQEALLFLPRTEHGRDVLHLAQLPPIASTVEWRKQRRLWRELGLAHGLAASV